MFLTVFLALGLTVGTPDSIIIDSRQTFEQAIAGTAAPDSIIQTLTLVDVEYYSFDGWLHAGQIVVHRDLADDIKYVFEEIKGRKFPVQSVMPIKFDKPDNGTSMDTLNNTYGFHYRPVATARTAKLSAHSYGRAVDINPFQNPAVLKSGKILPAAGCYDPQATGTLTGTVPITQLFRQLGWTWGGSWISLKDYMHFEKP